MVGHYDISPLHLSLQDVLQFCCTDEVISETYTTERVVRSDQGIIDYPLLGICMFIGEVPRGLSFDYKCYFDMCFEFNNFIILYFSFIS